METKVLRSFIHERFPMELRVKIELLSKRRDILNEEKHEEFIKLLQESDVGEFTRLGPGTNRYAVKIDGFVVKVATDHDGKIDNLKEFKMAKRLFPHVAKTYEVSENGTLLIAEYVPPFESYTEMCRYATQIRSILNELSSVYLIGDVGISPNNYANWGIRVGTNQPVCLDFAYVYEVSSKLFICRQCKNNSMLVPDPDFNILICPSCQHKSGFPDIRAKIGNDIHRHEIGDLSEEGYRLTESFVPTQLTESRSNYLVKKQKKKDTKKKHNEVSKPTEEELTMEKSELTKSLTGKPFGPAPVYVKAVSRPSKGSDQFNPVAISVPREEAATPPMGEVGSVAFTCSMEDDPEEITAVSVPRKAEEVVQRPDMTGYVDQPGRPAVTVPVKNVPPFDPTAPRESDEPIVEDEVVDAVEDTATNPHDEISEVPEEFMEHAADAISKFSNKAETLMRNINLYAEVKQWLINKRKIVSERDFYRVAQNAIYRSLAGFMNFKEIAKPRDNGSGTIKTFVPQEDPSDKPYKPTLLFFYLCWEEDIIRDSADAGEIIEKYRASHSSYMGIQPEWRAVLVNRLKTKMPIDIVGINAIADKLTGLFCCEELPEPEVEAPDEEEEEVAVSDLDRCTSILAQYHNHVNGADDFSLDDMTQILILSYSKGGTKFELYADLVRISLYGTAGDKIVMHHSYADMADAANGLPNDIPVFDAALQDMMNQADGNIANHEDGSFSVNMEDDPEEDEEDSDYEDDGDDDDDPIEGVSVEISMGEKFDYIRVVSRDPDDTVAIPFYTSLDSVDPASLDTSIYGANGIWDWLTHLAPRLIFTTRNPQKYLDVNKIEPTDENAARFVILEEDEDGSYVMGLYIMEGIYEIFNDEAVPCYDEDRIARINAIVVDGIGMSSTSFYKWHDIAPVVEESEVSDIIDSADDDDEDPFEPDHGEGMSAMTAAALAVLTGSAQTGDVPVASAEPTPAPAPDPVPVPTAPPAPVTPPKANKWKPVRRHS